MSFIDRQLTSDDAMVALRDHVETRAAEARRRYGGVVDYAAILRMLDDRTIVRYPTELRFAAGPLEGSEFGYAHSLGERPSDGFHLFIHPSFENRTQVLPLLIAYHLVRINYGEIVTHEEAELFGAELLGLDREEYYQSLCALADSIPPPAPRGEERCPL